jgi:hypothetical protein
MDRIVQWEAYIKSINHYSLQKKIDKSSITDNSKKPRTTTIYIYNKNYSFLLQTVMILKPYYNQKTAMESIKKILQCVVQELFYKRNKSNKWSTQKYTMLISNKRRRNYFVPYRYRLGNWLWTTNAEAVAKIYKLKQRAETQSMIVLMNGEKWCTMF